MGTESNPPRAQLFSESSILGPVLLTAVFHLAVLITYVSAFGGDWSALVCADETKFGRGPLETVQVGFPRNGYDGQFYFILAQSPWTVHDSDFIDNPPFRHSRILYPAMAWLLSGGNSTLLLGVMPAINLAAISALAAIGALLSLHYGRSSWWGFLLPLVVNAGMPALRDLTDPLATTMVCGTLAAYLLNWPVWQLGLCAAAAALCREQSIILVLLIGGDALLEKRWPSVVALAAAGLVWLAWMVGVTVAYEASPLVPGSLSAPFSGVWYCITHLTGAYGRPPILNVIGMLLILLQMAIGGILLFRASRLTVAITAAAMALVLLASAPVYLSSWSYVRVFVWLPLGIWLWSVQTGRRWPVVLLLPNMIWLLLATAQPWVESRHSLGN